jgi:hypothetical protein
MKTPREILLGRHQTAVPKLDAIRREVVADTEVGLDRRASRNLISTVAPSSLRELILSLRWHFAAMSAVWLVAALLTVDPSPAPSSTVVERNTASPRQILIALQENRRLLLEMIEPPAVKPPSAPLPRSERQPRNAVV